jgi:catechol 2,3-dioxygenase-like lactoylglutathione lyase family enzyme
MSIPGLTRLDHVGLTVPDLDQAREFFVDVLGCEYMYAFGAFSGDASEGSGLRRLSHFPVLAIDKQVNEGTEPEIGFRRMPQRSVEAEGVLVAPSDPLPVQIAGLFEVGDDGLDRSFGDEAGGGNGLQPCVRVPCDGQQHPRMVGQERPPAVLVIHGVSSHARPVSRFMCDEECRKSSSSILARTSMIGISLGEHRYGR